MHSTADTTATEGLDDLSVDRHIRHIIIRTRGETAQTFFQPITEGCYGSSAHYCVCCAVAALRSNLRMTVSEVASYRK